MPQGDFSIKADAVTPAWWTRLKKVPIADPIDQRNAAMFRILLVFMGLSQPLTIAAYMVGPTAQTLEPLSLVLAAASTVVAWICFLILHRGRFKLAADLFVATSLAFLIYGYWRWGFVQQQHFQLGQVYPVLVGGLLLNRRALWLCTAALLGIFLVGVWRDFANMYYALGVFDRVVGDLVRTVLALLVIALILDRAVANLRESLAVALKRGSDLARIRDRMQLEIEEKDRSREQMLHAQKMQAVGRLTSGIAHDFNHLLTLIVGYARRGREGKDMAELRQSLIGVESAAKRATVVSHKLLSFARQGLTHVETFDAIAAVNDMRPVFAQLFDPRTRIVYELADETLSISFDRTQFELMLLNIAANANDAMPNGGRFVVTVRPMRDAAQVEIEIADSGHGMSEEVKRCLFDPFFTTKPAGQGTGLGLHAVFNMVDANDGTITVDSAPGTGASFRIRLPLAAGPAANP